MHTQSGVERSSHPGCKFPSLVQHDALPKITKVLVCEQESRTPAGPPAMNLSDCGTGPSKLCSPPLDSGRQQRTSSALGESKRATDVMSKRCPIPHMLLWFVRICHETSANHAIAALRNWAHTKRCEEITPDFLKTI